MYYLVCIYYNHFISFVYVTLYIQDEENTFSLLVDFDGVCLSQAEGKS
jgi:hypothetical protein